MSKSRVSLETLPPGFRYVHVVVTSKEYGELQDAVNNPRNSFGEVAEVVRNRMGWRDFPWGFKKARDKINTPRTTVEDLVQNR